MDVWPHTVIDKLRHIDPLSCLQPRSHQNPPAMQGAAHVNRSAKIEYGETKIIQNSYLLFLFSLAVASLKIVPD